MTLFLVFLFGGAVMMVIDARAAETATRIPEAGSEYIYAYRICGYGIAFMVRPS